ncbi:MAG: hypothetical protein MZU95_13395 [Desulfomicrobium escambiense]|nr:hypothetical protein [Desulfomicrobium escambiense]
MDEHLKKMGAVMEVKPGYKQTEVGVIPEDWDVKRLDAMSIGLEVHDGVIGT